MEKLLKAKADFLEHCRSWMKEKGYLEVSTPYLVKAGAFEACIDTFKVKGKDSSGELHSSPEFAMKRILSEVPVPIFQICKCFRDDPDTGHHLKEFTMLEFYRIGDDLEGLISDVKGLLTSLSSTAIQTDSMDELFRKALGYGLDEIRPEKGDSWEDAYFKLLVQSIEPSLDPNVMTLVKDYPAQQSVLGKLNAKGWVDRFEIYWKGMEICNGCVELNDLKEMNRRHEEEKKKRSDPHPYPEVLSTALKEGLPPCAGVAVGLDRLFACLHPESLPFKPQIA